MAEIPAGMRGLHLGGHTRTGLRPAGGGQGLPVRSSSFRRAIVVEGGFTLPQTHMDKSPHHGLRSRKVSPAPKLPLSKL